MKTLMTMLAVMLVFAASASADGVTFWALTEKDVDSTQNAIIGRLGYQKDFLEGFIGSTWRPHYKVEEGEIAPPQVFSLGGIVHLRDLLDPNNPLPWIPDLLLTLIPEKMVAQPYFGLEASFNFFESDAGFYGGIVGLLCKADPNSKSTLVIEAGYADYFKDLAAVDDEFQLRLGLRFYFN